jgi:hypothetical protein
MAAPKRKVQLEKSNSKKIHNNCSMGSKSLKHTPKCVEVLEKQDTMAGRI